MNIITTAKQLIEAVMTGVDSEGPSFGEPCVDELFTRHDHRDDSPDDPDATTATGRFRSDEELEHEYGLADTFDEQGPDDQYIPEATDPAIPAMMCASW